MSDVFEQVEEELRSERYKRLARVWLPVTGGVLLIALIAALSWWGYQTWETSKADKASVAIERGFESLKANNPVGADAAFAQAAKEGNSAYKALALQLRAGIAADDNRLPEALALMDEAAKASSDPELADLAGFKALWLAMDIETLEQIQARAAKLTGDKRPYAAFAKEAEAMALLQHGKANEAKDILIVLKNGLDTPEVISNRAAAALAAIESGSTANLQAIVRQMAEAPAPSAPQSATSQPPAAARP